MNNKNIFAEKDKDFDRRRHGCDGCREGVPTERFDGHCGGHLWFCEKCYKRIVEFGFKDKTQPNKGGKCNHKFI